MARIADYFDDSQKQWLELSLVATALSLIYAVAFFATGSSIASGISGVAGLAYLGSIFAAVRKVKLASMHALIAVLTSHLATLWLLAGIDILQLVPWLFTTALLSITTIPDRRGFVWASLSLGIMLAGLSLTQSPQVLTVRGFALVGNFGVAGLVFVSLAYRTFTSRVEKERQKAEKSSVLVQIVTHDIANPLTIVSGVCRSKLKALGPDNPDRKSWERVSTASTNMLQLLEEVKRLHAIQSGKISFTLQPVSWQEALKTCEFTFETKLADKNLTLETSSDKDNDIWFAGEPISFSNEVLHNLVSNAIKFSPRGSSIRIAATREDSLVHISVTDSGIGIPEKLRLILFDENKKTNRQGTEGEKGTGFGLPLLKHVIEAYGGRIEVESRPQEEFPDNHGTSFHLYLLAANKPATAKQDSERPKPSLKIA